MPRISDAPLPAGTSELMQNNLHRALANNPRIAERFYGLAESVHHDSTLATRVREFVILRVTAKLRSEFEFSHHFRGCQTVGVTVEEARAVRDGDLARFSDAERAAVALAEAVEACQVTDRVWADALAHYSEVELLDLVTAVAFYGFASRLTLALDIAADDGFPSIDES